MAFEVLKGSPILFFINRDDVEIFKEKYPSAYPTGDFRISAIASEFVTFPSGSETLLKAELYLSYFPSENILSISLNKYERTIQGNLTRDGFPLVIYDTLYSVELNGAEKENYLKNETNIDFFERYFLRKNTPPENKISQIESFVKSYFETTVPRSKVQQVYIAPYPYDSFDPDSNGVYVAAEKVYDVTIVYQKNGTQRSITTQFGAYDNHSTWVVPLKSTLDKLMSSTYPGEK